LAPSLLSWLCLRGAPLPDTQPAILREQLFTLMSGTVFLFGGLAAGAFAAIRRREGARLFAWLGVWSGLWGLRLLLQSPAVVAVLPEWLQPHVRMVWTIVIFLLLPVALLAWLELSRGKVRVFLQVMIALSVMSAGVNIGALATTGFSPKLGNLNTALTIIALAVLAVIVTVPRLFRKYLILPNRAVMVAGTLVFALEALYFNLSWWFHWPTTLITASLGLGALLFSFGYVGLQIAVAGERRLQSIEGELAIAREIQASILPASNPELKNFRVASAYRPMTAIAGDFYEFLPLDENRIGVLLADVTGHGVPAALIAAMIKVAVQSVTDCAGDPGEVLRRLNRIMSPELSGQLVSASYLLLDTQNGTALYSAAGHPPLVHLRNGRMERIESNGVPIGVLLEPDYPVRELRAELGDRFLLYTDGVAEPENARGEAFGDTKLEEVVRANRQRLPVEFAAQLLHEIRRWQPDGREQHDDITIVVVDMIAGPV